MAMTPPMACTLSIVKECRLYYPTAICMICSSVIMSWYIFLEGTLKENMRYIPRSLDFVQDKIRNIGSALFYSEHDSVLKFPTAIINALKVDSAGQIWFYLNKPAQFIDQLDSQFPARLDFFRKDRDYFLSVRGKAFIVTDSEEINLLLSLDTDLDRQGMEKMILVKLKIHGVGYFERSKKRNESKGWWEALVEGIHDLIMPGAPRIHQQYFSLK
jgi:general stress protein 26